jgi:hypothetical protein
MGGSSAVDSQSPPLWVADSHPPAPVSIADRGPASAGSAAPMPPPGPAGRVPRPTLPQSPDQAARDRVGTYLKGRLDGVPQPELEQDLANAIRAVDADDKALRAALTKLNLKKVDLGVEVYEKRKRELDGKIRDANWLKDLTGDIPKSEILRQLGEIADIDLRDIEYQAVTSAKDITAAMDKLLHARRPEEKQNAMAELGQAMKEANETLARADSFKDTDVKAWQSALDTAKNPDEQKLCAKGYHDAEHSQERLSASVAGLRKILDLAKPLMSHADPSAKHAAQQYREWEEAQLEEAYKLLAELRRDDSKQAARNRERDEDAERIAAAGAQERSAQTAAERVQANRQAVHAEEEQKVWRDRLADAKNER